MTNRNKCRICLADTAEYPIFASIDTEESIYFKLCECFKEKIEDIDGYPQKICGKCKDLLHTVYNFITQYKTTCKLLESSLTIIKKEVCTDDDLDSTFLMQEIELEKVKDEPESDWLESLDDSIWDLDSQVKKPETSLNKIKAKLKSLKEINFKKKPVQKSKVGFKTKKIASSILEAEFVWNEERWCLKSSKLQKPNKQNPKGNQTDNKLVLPRLPKVPQPPVSQLCDICGDIFKDNDKLNSHKERKHFSSPIDCPSCPRILFTKLALKRHTRRCHGTKPFICDTCGQPFAFHRDLDTHIKTVHLKIKLPLKKNHTCHRCDKAFTNSKSLIIHERSAHTGMRPAECTECNASFFHEDYLKEHMRLHTGETPFKCPICGRGYAQRGNMKSHISHNHRLSDLSQEVLNTLKPSYLKILKKP